LDAISRRDVDGALAAYRPGAVWDMSSGGLGIFEGRERIRTFFEDWLRVFDDYEQALEEFYDMGNGVTVTVARQRG
jgi:ketosteroid isomerase-like protein